MRERGGEDEEVREGPANPRLSVVHLHRFYASTTHISSMLACPLCRPVGLSLSLPLSLPPSRGTLLVGASNHWRVLRCLSDNGSPQ